MRSWSPQRLGVTFAIISALGFSFKAILVKLAYAVPQPVPVDAVTLLALRMLFALPVFVWVALRAQRTTPPLTLREWLSWVRGPKAHAIWSRRDPVPFVVDVGAWGTC